MLSHSSLPLAEIKRAAGILPGQPLYDVLFVYQESLYSGQRGRWLVTEAAHHDYLETRLLVEVEPTEHDFKCRITYHLEHWPRAQIEVLLEEFRCVLGHILGGPHRDVASMRQCFPSKLLSQHNIQPTPLPGGIDLAALVASTAAKIPEKAAVCFATSMSDDHIKVETLTYRELDGGSNQIARCLHSRGVAPGSVVAIIMEKSVRLYIGILGILKAGCAYLPLLPTTPRVRVGEILRQAHVPLCVVDANSKPTLECLGYDTFDLEAARLDHYSDADLETSSDGSRIANIIYTSGSTGTPKGVSVTHLNLVSNLDVLSRIYPVAEGSRLLQSCSQAFDVSVFEIFFAWMRGMSLCSAVNDILFEDLERAIRMLQVTHLSMTPTVAALVNPANVPKVEFLVTSGEPMTEKVAEMWVGQLYQGEYFSVPGHLERY